MLATLLTLADSRLPAGGHAHSAGAEQAVTERVVTDLATLALFLRRRLATSGTVAAALSVRAAVAAAAAVGAAPAASALDRAAHVLAGLEDEADARMPLAATRAASRAQGRGLLRVGRAAWPSAVWDLLPRAPHQAVALGVAGALGGAAGPGVAVVAAYQSLVAPATAAQRLLGLDPVAVTSLLVSMTGAVHAVADAAAADAAAGVALPLESDVLAELLTAGHTPRKDKLFAS